MPAVTVAAGYPENLVNGNFREVLYRVNIAAPLDWLDVPLRSVRDVHLTDNGVTACGVAAVTRLTSGLSRIFFSTGGAINNCYVRAIGW